jgi:hypothetical protein
MRWAGRRGKRGYNVISVTCAHINVKKTLLLTRYVLIPYYFIFFIIYMYWPSCFERQTGGDIF